MKPKTKAIPIPIPMSEDEKRWRAEDDARILKRYAELQLDKTRITAATKILQTEKDMIDRAMPLLNNKIKKKK